MKVSVIIPSYNQGRFIDRTIKSIITQKNCDFEILVFDAGSTDNTINILKSYADKIKWVSETDRGQTDAINKGLRLATGDIHCYLNSDDVFYPGALQEVVKTFSQNNNIRALYGDADHIDENDKWIEDYYNESWNFKRLLELCYICQPATFWRKEITQEYGLFDDTLQYAMDYEYWLRVGSCEAFYYLKGIKLAGSRMYAQNKTLAFRTPVHREILKVARRYTLTPYRWLKVLSDLESLDTGGKNRLKKYVQNIISNAKNTSIPIDGKLGMEIVDLLLNNKSNQNKASRVLKKISGAAVKLAKERGRIWNF
jgi:glycosyltransferase involved in cell wall biosynthesis